MNMFKLFGRLYREAEGGDGGGAGDGGAGGNGGAGAGAGSGGSGSSGDFRWPDSVPEKFRNKENDVNKALLATSTSYLELEKSFRSKEEDIAKTLTPKLEEKIRAEVSEKFKAERAPKDGYKVDLSGLELPEGVEYKIQDGDPMVAWWSETAKAMGLSQEEYNAAIVSYAKNQISLAQSANDGSTNLRKSVAEGLGEGGDSRIGATDNWLSKNVGGAHYERLIDMVRNKDDFLAVEHLVRMVNARNPNMTNFNDIGGFESSIDNAELKQKMADPRYWKDPAYRDQVSREYQQHFSKKT